MSPVRVFYVYAQEDEELRQELEKHLSGMTRSSLIETWYNRKLQVNINWAQEVDAHLESADIIVLLISEYFIASGYAFSLEMKRALERYDSKDAHVIPILLRPTKWKETPFGRIQVLPTGGVPVTEWQERDGAFLDIAKGIRKAVTAISISSLARIKSSANNQDQQTENIIPKELTEPEKDKNTLLPSRQSTIEETARSLEMKRKHDHRTVLILGARAGRLFRSEDFFKTLQLFSIRDFSKLSHSQQFAECFFTLKRSSFSDTDIHTIIGATLQNSVITAADTCLAELVSQRYFDEIITTNIDDGLEKVLYEMHSEFEIVIPSSNHRQFWEEKRLPVRVTKVFGDFSSGIYSMQGHASTIIDDPLMKHSLQHTLSRDILVIGIDPIWDKDILRLIPESTNTMIFANEENLAENELISNLLSKRPTQYILASYDRFMKELYFNLYERIPSTYQIIQDLSDQLTDLKKQLALLYGEIKDLRQKISRQSPQSE